ncbi:aspartyl/asparaginyl beta-hydroxylase domain-containing protein [Saccharopolyspora sp. ASAGF58]|uniref:aspartyl/asparaginyl beta-hydroxylase domain-containing protein n=1 Tax=Saccharopolyspora sp. ASAGF58 TaxID=2719023 RepID=UPI001447DF2E|nr:aspartyl/asparaginyl beta-hydroxylase domain-containing protein [Saccharopolyspora sp. ASAGF58]
MDIAECAEPGSLPEAVRLVPTVDAGRLLTELAQVTDRVWDKQRIYDASGVGAAADIDWRVLALRSPGGDVDRTDPGGPGPVDFAPTPALERMPYMREILAGIPAPLNAVRLMALGPGASSIEHRDPKYSLQRGLVRLHIPVVTNPNALLILDGVTHQWQPGEFWFGDFSRPHQVQNHGTTTRIHAVIDALVTPELIALLPQPWRDQLVASNVLVNRQSMPAIADLTPWLPYSIKVPRALTDFTHDTPLELTADVACMRIETAAGLIRLIDGEGRSFALVHLGENEFRFAGWSEQRTIQLRSDSAVLRVRHGGRMVHAQTVPVAGPAME